MSNAQRRWGEARCGGLWEGADLRRAGLAGGYVAGLMMNVQEDECLTGSRRDHRLIVYTVVENMLRITSL